MLLGVETLEVDHKTILFGSEYSKMILIDVNIAQA